jgi:MoxR-like ATPase
VSDPAYTGSGGSFASDPAGGRASSTGVFPGRIPRLEEGVSPRGTLALVRASQGLALVRGREYVTPEDIQECAIPVLAHRCLFQGISSAKEKEDRILTALARTEVPTENWKRG